MNETKLTHNSPEVTNEEPIALTTLSKLYMYVLCEQPNCLFFVRFVSLGTTYILLEFFITLIHPLTNLLMHSLSFELGQTNSWTMVRNLICCWKASLHRCAHACFTYNAHIRPKIKWGHKWYFTHPTWHSLPHPLLSLHFWMLSHLAQLSPHPHPHPQPWPDQNGVTLHIRLRLQCHSPNPNRS